MNKPRSTDSVRVGDLEFVRTNLGSRGWRDAYHAVLSLSWPRFGLVVLVAYLALNLAFAAAYALGGACIEGMPPGSFSTAFFYSVQTLSTVGFGHLYPVTLYGNIVTTVEIVIGMFYTAVVTGLIFVRFSRPVAAVLFSRTMVICPFDGKPALQLRVVNLRRQVMVEAEFRLILLRMEPVAEGGNAPRYHTLELELDRLIMFPNTLTIRHFIDEQSPLYGVTPEQLEKSHARFMASIVCVDTVIPASVQSEATFTWRDVEFGRRFVVIYTEREDGSLEVDYGRVHETEPFPGAG